MKPNAREVARQVLARVEGGSYATLALAGELGRSGLSDADRALATELVYGVLRRRLRLDRALAAHAPRGLDELDGRVRDALRLAAHQILFLRVPAHAAVDDAVGAVRRLRGARLGGFANALLRRLSEAGEPPPPPGSDPAARLALLESTPGWLVRRVIAMLGAAEAERLLAAFNTPAPTWLRANTLRLDGDGRARLAAALRAERPRIELRETPLAPDALAATHGGDLFSTAAYGAGAFLAQDLGAQLVARMLEPQPGEALLDACAGVGGKSTYLAALTGDRADVDAADLSERKLELAADHAHRLGIRRLRTIRADLTDAAAPLRPAYDRILLDAPCSGLGVLRRHPEAKWRVKPDDITALAELQGRLLAALAPRVKPGGVLVYAVCTFTEQEGVQQVRAFLAAHPDFWVEPWEAGPAVSSLVGADGALRTWPQRDDADAFYAVRMRRHGAGS